MIKGIIFDLDGTLLDSMDIWETLAEQFLLAQDITPPPALNEIVKPLSSAQATLYLCENFFPEQSPEQVQQNINALIKERYIHKTALKAHVPQLLRQVRAWGLKICVATATDRYLALGVLERLGILEQFEFVLTCEEVGSGKESPQIYHCAMERLGLLSSEVVIFEDALHCIKTAKLAGYNVIGVYDKTLEHEGHLQEARAWSDYFINDYSELWKQGR